LVLIVTQKSLLILGVKCNLDILKAIFLSAPSVRNLNAVCLNLAPEKSGFTFMA